MARKKDYSLTPDDCQDIGCRVRWAIRKKVLHENDRCDVEQELAIFVVKAKGKFCRTEGKWQTFRRTLIKNRLFDLIRARTSPKSYEGRRAPFSIDDPIPTAGGQFDDLLWKDAINQDGVFADGTERGEEIERLDLIMDVRDAVSEMPKHLQRMSYVLMNSGRCSKAELTTELHVSVRTVFYWFDELKKYLSDRGFGDRI